MKFYQEETIHSCSRLDASLLIDWDTFPHPGMPRGRTAGMQGKLKLSQCIGLSIDNWELGN